MAGLVPAIHVFLAECKDVDARAKRRHDVASGIFYSPFFAGGGVGPATGGSDLT
jgi:hypothetical protein